MASDVLRLGEQTSDPELKLEFAAAAARWLALAAEVESTQARLTVIRDDLAELKRKV